MGVMLDCTLSTEQLAELRVGHRRTRDKREADRIKAVVLLAIGWSAEEVAEVLLVDPTRCARISSVIVKMVWRACGV